MRKIAVLIGLVIGFISGSYAQAADDILGVWLTEGGKSKVEVVKKDGKYTGTIIWLKDPNREDGTIKLDRNNENEKLQTRKILGINVIKDFEWDDDEYEDGTIYDPENGKTYSCVITFSDKNTLDVRGYIGFSLIGRTSVWTRVK